MGRPPCCDKANVKRGLWTPEEDAKILAYVANHGTGNWTLVPKKAGLNRCGKSCRLRWTNYLRPDLKHESFSPQEEDLIIELHKAIGSRWSLIAKQLPGRTDNDVKNYWNTKLKKKLKKMGIDPVTHKPFSQIISDYGNISSINPQLHPAATTNHRKFFNHPSSFAPPPMQGGSSSRPPVTPLLTPNLSSPPLPPSTYQISSMTTTPLSVSAQFQPPPNTEFVMTSPYLFDQASSPASSSSSSSSITVITPSSQSKPSSYQIMPPSSSSSSCWSNLLISGGEIDPPPPVLTEVTASQVGENDHLLQQHDFYNSGGGWDDAKDEGIERVNRSGSDRGGGGSGENSSSPMNSFVKSILDHDSELQQQLDFFALGEFLDY